MARHFPVVKLLIYMTETPAQNFYAHIYYSTGDGNQEHNVVEYSKMSPGEASGLMRLFNESDRVYFEDHDGMIVFESGRVPDLLPPDEEEEDAEEP